MKLGAKQVAESIGILAVIGSLLLVAIEVNQNSQLLEEEVRLARAEGKQLSTSVYVSFVDILLTNPEVSKTLTKSFEIDRLEEFTEDEYRIFGTLMLRAMFSFSDDHYRYSLGVLEQEEWGESLALLRVSYTSSSAFQQWWKETGTQYFGQRFINLINDEVRNAEDA